MYKAKLKALADQTKEKLASANKIRKTAADEKRELTDGEAAEVENLAGEIKAMNDERAKLKAKQSSLDTLDETASELERPQPRISTGQGPAGTSTLPEQFAVRQSEAHWSSRVIIPPDQRQDGKLIAFKGPHAKREAYAFGRFILSALGHRDSQIWCDDVGLKPKAALTGADNATGGALVPYELSAAIIDLAEEYGVFRQWAQFVPMTTETQGWPRVTSGMTAYFVGDNDAPTESNPAFDNVEVTAREAAAYAAVPAALAEDSLIALGDLVARKIAAAFANKEDECGFNGTGASTYGGIYGAMPKINDGNHAASIYTAISGNTAFSTLDLADFEAMIGQLPMYPGIQPAWFISRAGWAASMLRLTDAAGGNQGSMLVNGIPMPLFLGFPVVISQVLFKTLTASVSTAAFLFGDLRQAAMFGSRRQITIAAGGGGTFFTKRQTVILGSERFGITVHECGDGSNAGPLILCKFPGS